MYQSELSSGMQVTKSKFPEYVLGKSTSYSFIHNKISWYQGSFSKISWIQEFLETCIPVSLKDSNQETLPSKSAPFLLQSLACRCFLFEVNTIICWRSRQLSVGLYIERKQYDINIHNICFNITLVYKARLKSL